MDNLTRSTLAANALDTFTASAELGPAYAEEPPMDQIADLLANLLHLAHQEGWEFNLDTVVARAKMNFEAELEEEDEENEPVTAAAGVLTGADAQNKYYELLKLRENNDDAANDEPNLVAGYYKFGNHYVAFDNTTADCFSETYSTEQLAIRFCNGEEVEDQAL